VHSVFGGRGLTGDDAGAGWRVGEKEKKKEKKVKKKTISKSQPKSTKGR